MAEDQQRRWAILCYPAASLLPILMEGRFLDRAEAERTQSFLCKQSPDCIYQLVWLGPVNPHPHR